MESEDKNSVEMREGNPPVPVKSEEPKASEPTTQPPTTTDAKPSERANGNDKTKEKISKKKSSQKKTKKTPPPPESSDGSDSDEAELDVSQDDLDSDNDSNSDSEDTKKKRTAKKRHEESKSKKKTHAAKKEKKQVKVPESSSGSSSDSNTSDSDLDDSDADASNPVEKVKEQEKLIRQLQQMLIQTQQQGQGGSSYQQTGSYQQGGSYPYPNGGGYYTSVPPPAAFFDNSMRTQHLRRPGRPTNASSSQIDPNLLLDPKLAKERKKKQKATKLDYKRVDQVWDNTIHNYKLQDTAQGSVDAQYDEFLFHVRRTFDWEGKYKATVVDIKSKLLRECLQDVMGNIKGVSLVEETPKLDPNMLFL